MPLRNWSCAFGALLNPKANRAGLWAGPICLLNAATATWRVMPGYFLPFLPLEAPFAPEIALPGLP
jgi:hypothetical protein